MNAIITAATGYNEADLQPFLCSVDRACPDSKVFLIAYKRHLGRVERLRRRFTFVEPVLVPYKFHTGGSAYRWLARHFIDQAMRGAARSGGVWAGIRLISCSSVFSWLWRLSKLIGTR